MAFEMQNTGISMEAVDVRENGRFEAHNIRANNVNFITVNREQAQLITNARMQVGQVITNTGGPYSTESAMAYHDRLQRILRNQGLETTLDTLMNTINVPPPVVGGSTAPTPSQLPDWYAQELRALTDAISRVLSIEEAKNQGRPVSGGYQRENEALDEVERKANTVVKVSEPLLTRQDKRFLIRYMKTLLIVGAVLVVVAFIGFGILVGRHPDVILLLLGPAFVLLVWLGYALWLVFVFRKEVFSALSNAKTWIEDNM